VALTSTDRSNEESRPKKILAGLALDLVGQGLCNRLSVCVGGHDVFRSEWKCGGVGLGVAVTDACFYLGLYICRTGARDGQPRGNR
jgi:hypothetical protein